MKVIEFNIENPTMQNHHHSFFLLFSLSVHLEKNKQVYFFGLYRPIKHKSE